MKSVDANLKGPVYRYNAQTCRYERVGVSFWAVFSYGTGLLLCTAALLAGLLFLHDFLVDSEAEIAYRKENSALEKHYGILSQQLETVESKLASLHEKDDGLHQKFFASVSSELPTDATSSKAGILTTTPSGFRKALKEIKATSTSLIKTSRASNLIFSSRVALSSKDLGKLSALPVNIPVRELSPEKLLSGFGMRINPFHKGLYNHPGIDIALPRGTEVLSTAPGKVINAKTSDLQAGYGNFIDIDHGNGFITRYAHLEEIRVRSGQKIEKGMVIGTSGNSGGSVAPHLHYEILRDGANEDPILYMISGLTTDEYSVYRTVSQKQNQSLD